jgi:hypothetical protein
MGTLGTATNAGDGLGKGAGVGLGRTTLGAREVVGVGVGVAATVTIILSNVKSNSMLLDLCVSVDEAIALTRQIPELLNEIAPVEASTEHCDEPGSAIE